MTFYPTLSFLPTSQVDLLITIRPEHARAIYSGNKGYELRRAMPKSVPRRIFIYEGGGAKKVSGHFVIAGILNGSPDVVWKALKGGGITKSRFFKYFQGSNHASAFKIEAHVKYRQPKTLTEIEKIEPGFRAPQNFLYLENFPKLAVELDTHAFRECLTSVRGPIKLLFLTDTTVHKFKALVEEHITDSYLETGAPYAKKLLEVHTLPSDVEGIFTKKKYILEVHYEGKLVGFAVITEKVGGSIKTGPVVFIKKYRGKHIGRQLRFVLHEIFLNAGYRKIYCTTPINNFAAVRYLLASGYKIEAHLRKHYHHEHDEFVFGFKLTEPRGEPGEFIRQIVPHHKFEPLKKSNAEIVAFLRSQFSATFCDTNDEWANKQIELSLQKGAARSKSFKPRRLYIAYASSIVACALCIVKRGGSTKLIMLSQTGHVDSLSRFVSYIEMQLLKSEKNRVRKFYTHVPLTDEDVLRAFYKAEYVAEGVLTSPYRQSDDLIVLGKLLASNN